MFCTKTCLMGGHVLQDDMSYRIKCPTGGHITHEDIRTCLVEWNVIQTSYKMQYLTRTTCITGLYVLHKDMSNNMMYLTIFFLQH